MALPVNPVHALIGLLRNEAQRGILGREQKLQLNALADILLEARDAKERLGKLEEAIQRGELKQASAEATGTKSAEVKRPGWPDFEHEVGLNANPRDFSVRVGNATSDAITRALTERHGRTWDSYPSNDNDTTGATGGASRSSSAAQRAYRDPHADMPPGFAFPFSPTVEDVQHALKTGQGWPPELGEEVRMRILRESQKHDQAGDEPYPFWPFVIVICILAVLVFWFV